MSIKRNALLILVPLSAAAFLLSAGCGGSTDPDEAAGEPAPRERDIPEGAVKRTPENDAFPPVLLAAGWEDPVPLEGPMNTAGAEDAPVISPDGDTFLFFFTGDVNVPPYMQINHGTNGATGIWWSRREGGVWTEPERIVTWNDDTLDGPFWLSGDSLWYGSFRSDNQTEDGDIYVSVFDGSAWSLGRQAGDRLNQELNIGELCVTPSGDTLIYHATGGAGGLDLWMIERTGSSWSSPAGLGAAVNGAGDEGWPALSPDGTELWYTAESASGYTGPALWRSLRRPDGSWGSPEEIVANFAGDPAVDADGNVYFTHHFVTGDITIIEADIYVIRRR